ncbi:MAG: hypothetical protein QHH75_07130 [Bacillota bacterium]|nr:hypothetical protein [Bacillota bacterium]
MGDGQGGPFGQSAPKEAGVHAKAAGASRIVQIPLQAATVACLGEDPFINLPACEQGSNKAGPNLWEISVNFLTKERPKKTKIRDAGPPRGLA